MKITELFSLEDLELALQDGYVTERKHNTLPLTILNYTDKATYDQHWTDVTRRCRGLIVNNVTNEVIASGPAKFFNYGEPSAKSYPLDTLVAISRKEDGSLGIGWAWFSDEDDTLYHGIATRGSFASEQALHATALAARENGHNGRYELLTDALIQYTDDDLTYICEIVYPENRIVLDYAGRDELIPLGAVNNRTGLIQWRPEFDHNGNKIVAHSDVSGVITLGEALALRIPDDEEGYVLDIYNDAFEVIDHLKLKGDRYKELHAAIFGLTERRVYDAWVAGTESDLIEGLPDEVQPWALDVAQRLDRDWDNLMTTVREDLYDLFKWHPFSVDRKEQAQFILKHHKDTAPAVFALLDNDLQKCHAWIDKQLKPGHVPFSSKEPISV